MTGRSLDPDARDLLERVEAMGARPYAEIGVTRARSVVESARWMQRERAEIASVREVLLAGAAGRLPARVYHPRPGQVLPAIVYLHGGGWVAGSLSIADGPCRELARAAGCAVISVGYRRAPETPFPGPPADCVAALAWISAHAGDLGVDAARLALAGSSAGGNLAAAVALHARDHGGPLIVRQLLFYPPLAPAAGSPYASYRENGEGYMMTRADLAWFWAHYLPDGAEPPAGTGGFLAAPLHAADLSGLPPATIVTAEFDPLRDEGRDYARRITAAGGEAELVEVPGMIHGFSWMTGELARAAAVVDAVGAKLGERLRSLDARTAAPS